MTLCATLDEAAEKGGPQQVHKFVVSDEEIISASVFMRQIEEKKAQIGANNLVILPEQATKHSANVQTLSKQSSAKLVSFEER